MAACDKCGQEMFHGPRHAVCPAPSLQLLVIDMGDCCVVKVEKGHLPSLPNVRVTTGNHTVKVVDETFTDLRAALDGEKPVPRIEKAGSQYRVYVPDFPVGGSLVYETYEYDALSQLAGKPLPVWGGNGTWQKMNQQRITSDDTMSWSFDVWRYRR